MFKRRICILIIALALFVLSACGINEKQVILGKFDFAIAEYVGISETEIYKETKLTEEELLQLEHDKYVYYVKESFEVEEVSLNEYFLINRNDNTVYGVGYYTTMEVTEAALKKANALKAILVEQYGSVTTYPGSPHIFSTLQKVDGADHKTYIDTWQIVGEENLEIRFMFTIEKEKITLDIRYQIYSMPS